jgi:hypothetical protein
MGMICIVVTPPLRVTEYVRVRAVLKDKHIFNPHSNLVDRYYCNLHSVAEQRQRN